MNFNLPVFIARKLKQHPFAYNMARRVYCGLFPPIRSKVEQALLEYKEINFIKIGANDGLENDPLGNFILTDLRFKGVLVEPIPFISRRLAANYPDRSRFQIEQAAISKESGTARMYCVEENATDLEGRKLPTWVSGIGSFHREHLVNHLPPEFQKSIQEVTVPCLTFEEVLLRNRLDRLDLLHIDTEGHDFIIVQQISFEKWKPKVVIFEHKHLKDSDKVSAKRLMNDNGYKVIVYDSDFLCIRRPR